MKELTTKAQRFAKGRKKYGFFAFLCWMAAMTKFDLSYAYPFMSLSFLLVLVLSVALFHEPLTISKVVGVGFIVAGIIIGSRG